MQEELDEVPTPSLQELHDEPPARWRPERQAGLPWYLWAVNLHYVLPPGMTYVPLQWHGFVAALCPAA